MTLSCSMALASSFFGSKSHLKCTSQRPPALKLPVLNIRCARVGGVEIPNNKRIESSLQYVHGIGRTLSRQVLLDCGIENKHTRELSEEELTRLRDELSKYMIEGDLRRFTNLAIKRLKDIQCYRGRRHIMNLPVRGSIQSAMHAQEKEKRRSKLQARRRHVNGSVPC